MGDGYPPYSPPESVPFVTDYVKDSIIAHSSLISYVSIKTPLHA